MRSTSTRTLFTSDRRLTAVDRVSSSCSSMASSSISTGIKPGRCSILSRPCRRCIQQVHARSRPSDCACSGLFQILGFSSSRLTSSRRSRVWLHSQRYPLNALERCCRSSINRTYWLTSKSAIRFLLHPSSPGGRIERRYFTRY